VALALDPAPPLAAKNALAPIVTVGASSKMAPPLPPPAPPSPAPLPLTSMRPLTVMVPPATS
jgi:hypothetical protein